MQLGWAGSAAPWPAAGAPDAGAGLKGCAGGRKVDFQAGSDGVADGGGTKPCGSDGAGVRTGSGGGTTEVLGAADDIS